MKTVVFDIWGDLGHFRVPYTTSSPVTFPIPPKTALYGILGAILGYEKEKYLEKFNNKNWKFAVSVKRKIVTVHIPENFINTKAVKLFARMPQGKSCRTQINMEFLKNPYYRIYVTSDDEKELSRLEHLLKEHKSVYTVCLGISECIANFKYIGSYQSEKKEGNDFIEIASVIPLSYLTDSANIDFLKEGTKYLRIHLPTEMKPDRELVKTVDFLLEATGKTTRVKLKNYIQLKELNENILWF
jgi:CRISPR-associated protein Cas5h